MIKSFFAIPVGGLLLCLALAAAGQKRGTEVVEVKLNDQVIKLYEGSYALIVGESHYAHGWNPLPGVADDISAVRIALEQQGFKVEVALDLPSTQLNDRVNQFITDYGFVAQNRLLIYFAGHGHTLKAAGDGRDLGYIVPIDAPLPSRDETGFRQLAVSMDTIQYWARRIQAKHALFLFDSCFSGKLVSRGDFIVPPIIQESVQYPVRQFITAGAANQTVPDESIFRKTLVRGLEGEADRNGDGYITGSELADYIREKVTNYSNRSQTPQYGKINDVDLDRGDVVFVVPTKLNPVALARQLANQSFRQWKACRYDQALASANQAISAYPDLAEGHAMLGLTYLARIEIEPAIREFNMSIALKPDYALAYCWRAMAHDAEFWLYYDSNPVSKERELAQKDVDMVLRLLTNPREASEYEARGYAFYQNSKYDLAISDFDMAIQVDPQYLEAYVMRGFARDWKAGKFDFAGVNDALRLNANLIEAYMHRGFYLQNLTSEQDPMAIVDFSEVIRRSPKAAIAYYRRAKSFFANKDFDSAIKDLSTFIVLTDSHSFDGYFGRGKAYGAKQDFANAIKDFGEAIRIAPEPEHYVARAEMYMATKDYPQAIGDYTEAIRLSPDEADYHYKLGNLLVHQQRYQEAETELKEAVRLAPRNETYQKALQALPGKK